MVIARRSGLAFTRRTPSPSWHRPWANTTRVLGIEQKATVMELMNDIVFEGCANCLRTPVAAETGWPRFHDEPQAFLALPGGEYVFSVALKPCSADFQSAVSRVSNPQTLGTSGHVGVGHALPIRNRRYSRLETRATLDRYADLSASEGASSARPSWSEVWPIWLIAFPAASTAPAVLHTPVAQADVAVDGARHDYLLHRRGVFLQIRA